MERDDGTGVRVPAGALSSELELTVAGADAGQDAGARSRKRLERKLTPVSDEIAYGPEGAAFNAPVTLTLSYDPAQAALQGLDEDRLQVYFWNPARGDWEALPSQVDKNAHAVSAQTGHLSVYQVLGAGTAAASNTVATIQVACNPLRPDCRPMKFQGLPANARLRIYTLRGALVKDMATDSAGTAQWDGTNQSGASVASGVYFIFAQGAGTSKTLKIAVER